MANVKREKNIFFFSLNFYKTSIVYTIEVDKKKINKNKKEEIYNFGG